MITHSDKQLARKGSVLGGKKQGYTAVIGGNNGSAGVQVKSIDAKGNGHWKSLGIESSGGTLQGSVPWHNYSGKPAVRAMSAMGTGVNVTFSC